jgi:hypothetical protein
MSKARFEGDTWDFAEPLVRAVGIAGHGLSPIDADDAPFGDVVYLSSILREG